MTEPSAARVQRQFPGIIQWPCGDRPHRESIRAFFAWRELVAFPAATFAAFTIAPLVWGAVLHMLGADTAPAIAMLSLPGIVVWAAYFVVMVVPTFRVFRGGVDRTAKWRATWVDFEHQSTELKTRLQLARSNQLGLRYADVPELPAIRWHLLEYQDFSPQAIDVRGADRDQLQSLQEAALMSMLDAIAQLSPHNIVFKTTMDGAPAVGCCCMLGRTVQLWMVYSIRVVGSALVPRVQSGVQWWALRQVIADSGKSYPGDMWEYRVRTMDLNVSMIFAVLAYCLVAPLGMFGAAALIVIGGRQVLRQMIRRDRARRLAAACDFDGGDSTDLQLLQEHRRLTGYGLAPGAGVTADYKTLQGQIVHLAGQVMSSLKVTI